MSFTPAEFFVRLLALCSHTQEFFFPILFAVADVLVRRLVAFGFLYHLQMRKSVTSSRTRGFFFVFFLFFFCFWCFFGLLHLFAGQKQQQQH